MTSASSRSTSRCPENFLAGLREGLKVSATAAAFPGREFAGIVTGVDSRIDPVTRSVTVRANVPNPELSLKPGMFLNVSLSRDAHDALMVPEAALVPEQSRQFLFVVEDGRATRREVRIGRRRPGRVEVIDGLEGGRGRDRRRHAEGEGRRRRAHRRTTAAAGDLTDSPTTLAEASRAD